MIKVVSVYLISKVVDSSGNPVNYNDVYEILWKLQGETRMLKNKAVQLYWEWNNFSSDYYKKNGVGLKDNEVLNTSSQNFVYHKLTPLTSLQSANVSAINQGVYKHFEDDKEDYRNGKKSIASYKEKQPIDLSNQCIKLNYNDDDKNFSFTLFLLNQIAKKEYGIDRFDFECIAKK